MPRGLLYLLSALLLTLAETSRAQKAQNWRAYKKAQDLPSAVCTSVTVDPHGKVLVTHPGFAGVSELDGYTVRVIPAPIVLTNRVYESPAGQLWTVVPDGLLEFKTGVWSLHPVPEIAAVVRSGAARPLDPVPLFPLRQGLVLFLLPGQLLDFDCSDPYHPRTRLLREAGQTQLGSFTGLSPARERDGGLGLWITGARGLAKVNGPVRLINPEGVWHEYLPPASLQIQSFQELHEDKYGAVTAVAESALTHQRMLVHFDGRDWTPEAVPAERIRYGWRGPEGDSWAATANALFQGEEGGPEMAPNEEISARTYYDLAVEPGGAFWLATSDGLFRYTPLAWRSPRCAQKINSPVHCLAGDKEGQLWFISGSALHVIRNESHEEYPFPGGAGRRLQSARLLLPLKNGALLLDARGQLFKFQPAAGTFSLVTVKDRVGRFKVLGLLKDGSVCLQSFLSETTNQPSRLELYDGTRFDPFPNPPPDSALGGELTVLYAAQNGDLWLSGEQGTARCHDQKWQVLSSLDQTTPRAALGFVEVGDGRTWCATENRIWEFNGRDWLGGGAGFDRINGLVRTRDGNVWVAANSGLYRYLPTLGAWIENGSEEGLPSASVREVCEDGKGRLWAGTMRGLSSYDPETDKDPPQTRIREWTEAGRKIQEGGTIALSFSTSRDKWNYTLPARLLFSYRLDDHEWSPFSEENGVSFAEQAAGRHYLSVRALDRNGNVEANPVRFEFDVILPWYKETRLLLISLAGLAGALFFAGLAFNRHQRLLRSYAEVEKKVAQRTQELELANQELLHSQKMTALGTLAAGIAHDFNNILSIIQGSAQIIEDNVDNPQKVRTRVDRIKTVVGQGAGIVKAMLGFSRDSGQMSAGCDVNSVAEETSKLLGDRFLREVHVQFDPAPTLPPVTASKDFVQQILLNFIFNAAEAMTGRKRIILTTASVDRLPLNLVLVPAKADSYVALSVRDFGCGILPANLPRIFEPFFTTKAFSARRGTGLGLSMVYELARKMEAGLAVESVVDQGSTFTLLLAARSLPADK